jgi:hypothetical protein
LTEARRVRAFLGVSLVTYFRALLLIYAVLVFGELLSGQYTMDSFPESVRTFQEEQWKNLPEDRALALMILVRAGLGFMAVSLVGLSLLWRPARMLFTVYLLLIAIMVVLAGPTIESELTTALSFMNTIIAGVILGMVYFSPLREYFDQKPPA